MNISILLPSASKIKAFLAKEKSEDYTYPEVGASRTKGPDHYDNDYNSVSLGEGLRTWELAKSALDQWDQFPTPWTMIKPKKTPIREGEVVAVLFRIWGFWFMNSARIVYVLDEPNRYGFAYGTLPGHIEKGEECFWIERDEKGEVTYHIRAFSTPRFWLVRLGYPIARMYQRKFVKESMAQMKAMVKTTNHSVFSSTKI